MKTLKCYGKIILTFLLFGLLSQDTFCQSGGRLFDMYWDSPDTTFVIDKHRTILTITKSEDSLSILKEKKKRAWEYIYLKVDEQWVILTRRPIPKISL